MKDLFQIKDSDIENYDFGDKFISIAKELMGNYFIEVGSQVFLFSEIEFYFRIVPNQNGKKSKHDDVYTHPQKNPFEAGRIRHHYSGFDISLRGANNKGFGGILVRGVKYKDKNEFISGPLKVKNDLLNLAFKQEKISFKLKKEKGVAGKSIHIKKSERIGLSNKNEDEDEFIKKKYRFVAYYDNPKHPFKDKIHVQSRGE